VNTPHDSLLGREVAYPTRYDPSLLFPIARASGRAAIGLSAPLPFVGHDRWHAYELSWLDARGKPRVATATFVVPCDSPCLVESKSLKLYLNSLNAHHFESEAEVLRTIADDLSRVAGATVEAALGLPPLEGEGRGRGENKQGENEQDESIDALEVAIDRYGPPDPMQLHVGGDVVEEVLRSDLLKSNCPVTGQPDWAGVRIAYRGARINHEGLLRYLVSFREHAEFHEQCVERIFTDLLARCAPQALSVEARYTRRGGLDINPWRATPGTLAPAAGRDLRQ
jgi:7-cyano-7-deazaguanine reductase